jgi:hypothetical protein
MEDEGISRALEGTEPHSRRSAVGMNSLDCWRQGEYNPFQFINECILIF